MKRAIQLIFEEDTSPRERKPTAHQKKKKPIPIKQQKINLKKKLKKRIFEEVEFLHVDREFLKGELGSLLLILGLGLEGLGDLGLVRVVAALHGLEPVQRIEVLVLVQQLQDVRNTYVHL